MTNFHFDAPGSDPRAQRDLDIQRIAWAEAVLAAQLRAGVIDMATAQAAHQHILSHVVSAHICQDLPTYNRMRDSGQLDKLMEEARGYEVPGESDSGRKARQKACFEHAMDQHFARVYAKQPDSPEAQYWFANASSATTPELVEMSRKRIGEWKPIEGDLDENIAPMKADKLGDLAQDLYLNRVDHPDGKPDPDDEIAYGKPAERGSGNWSAKHFEDFKAAREAEEGKGKEGADSDTIGMVADLDVDDGR
jgi:hypothetical protein